MEISESATARTDLARRGEALAARHLTGLGMVVLARNWRCPAGEADLVLRDGDVLVVCEVKTRAGSGFGDPLEAVTPAKAARQRRIIAAYAAEQPGWAGGLRVDAVGILWPAGETPFVRHVRGVLS